MYHYDSFLQKGRTLLQKQGTEKCAYLFHADFLEFKMVNFLYGEASGDALIQAAEDYLDRIPKVALYEHLFSDQFIFLVIIPSDWTESDMLARYKHHTEAFLAAERLLYPECLPRIYSGVCPVWGENLMGAINCANAGWRRARKEQTAEPVLFDMSMQDSIRSWAQMSGEVNLALREERFIFYLQPQVDLSTGQIVSAEALAREIKEDGTIACPKDFLPAMEDSGTVVDLDILIFEQVCRHLERRLKQGRPVVRISVNLSHRHIKNEGTAKMIHTTACHYGISPDLIGFELVETIPPNELYKAKRLLDQLRSYGYETSIDDFGSGYAGINIWQELDFDMLKLDQSFLSDEEPLRTKNSQIVPNIINIAKGLNTKLLCEGIDRAEQCQWLYEMGCRLVQGYYFSPPVPAEQFYKLYEQSGGYAALVPGHA